MADDLTFETPMQKIIYRNFLQFITHFGFEIEISFYQNRAYFNLPNQNICLSVFPYRNEGLHFEFTKDLSKPFNTYDSIPVYVNNPQELEVIKPAVKIMFITKGLALNSSPQAEPQNVAPEKPQGIRRAPATTETATGTSREIPRVINRFFGN